MQNFTFNFPGMGGFSLFWAVIISIAFVLLHILFMVGVKKDGERLQQLGRQTVILPPFTWGLAALLTGLMGIALYWVAHYSIFIRHDQAQGKSDVQSSGSVNPVQPPV